MIVQKIKTYWETVGEHNKVLDNLNTIAPSPLHWQYSGWELETQKQIFHMGNTEIRKMYWTGIVYGKNVYESERNTDNRTSSKVFINSGGEKKEKKALQWVT